MTLKIYQEALDRKIKNMTSELYFGKINLTAKRYTEEDTKQQRISKGALHVSRYDMCAFVAAWM